LTDFGAGERREDWPFVVQIWLCKNVSRVFVWV